MSDETLQPPAPASGSKSAPISVVLPKDPAGKTGLGAFVENLAKWRDGTLVLAGLAYVLGYLSWAIYAANRELGLAPVLDAQYFAAGVFPAAIVIASCFVVWWLRCLRQWIKKPVSRSGKRVNTILERAGIFLVLPGFVLFFVSKWVAQISKLLMTVSAVLIVVGTIAIIVSSFFSREKEDVWYHRFLMSVAWIYLPLVGVSAFLFYTTKIFPGLPQAFGGPRPQCIQLDVDVSKVSASTLHLLAPEWQESHTYQSGIVRSRSLNLIFQNSEYLFLQVDRPTPPLPNQVFKLKSSAVESLFPVAE
jgi:hypothetical protein